MSFWSATAVPHDLIAIRRNRFIDAILRAHLTPERPVDTRRLLLAFGGRAAWLGAVKDHLRVEPRPNAAHPAGRLYRTEGEPDILPGIDGTTGLLIPSAFSCTYHGVFAGYHQAIRLGWDVPEMRPRFAGPGDLTLDVDAAIIDPHHVTLCCGRRDIEWGPTA
jgi:hypothetical protein